jgi:iron complex transport system substrate-binding protein
LNHLNRYHQQTLAKLHDQHQSRRIVSLIPSGSEVVCALGRQSDLVGRSHECDFPAEILKLPICSRPKIDITRSSAGIDQQIKALWQRQESNQGADSTSGAGGSAGGAAVTQAFSIYDIDVPLLDRLQPDIIITQSQCQVCAVSLADVEQAICKMIHSQPQILSCEPTGLQDVFDDIESIAQAIGIAAKGKELVGQMRQQMQHVAGRVERIDTLPTVTYIEWIDPLMAGGNWMPSLIQMAGGKDLFGYPDRPSPKIQWQDVIDADPDVLVVCPCGFDLVRTQSELGDLISLPGWADLKAVRTKRVYLADGHQYFNRPGPRLVDSLEMLGEMFHPERFDFGHRTKGWLPLYIELLGRNLINWQRDRCPSESWARFGDRRAGPGLVADRRRNARLAGQEWDPWSASYR